MKALSKLKAEEGIWMTDVPEPEVGHNDLLIKIRKTAICGTDVHIYNWDEWSQKNHPRFLWLSAMSTLAKWSVSVRK
ncbi:L-threonine 3-dehydrogenase [Citrobacter amalonaticus]|nr:L-threonine 3-dehydrogenase [Citrobacter amalonaticus]